MSCFRHREEKGEGGKGMLANVHNIPLGSLYLLSTGRDHHSSLSVSLRRVNFPYFTTGHTDMSCHDMQQHNRRPTRQPSYKRNGEKDNLRHQRNNRTHRGCFFFNTRTYDTARGMTD